MNTTPTTETFTSQQPSHQQIVSAGDGGRFFAELDHAFGAIENQTLIPQSRCVDYLLDLWNATHNNVLRAVVSAALEDIRRVTAVLRDDMHASLSVVAVAANVEL